MNPLLNYQSEIIKLHGINGNNNKLAKVNYSLGTVLTGENISYFSNSVDLLDFDEFLSSPKDYKLYKDKKAIPFLLYDMNLKALNVALINDVTWQSDNNNYICNNICSCHYTQGIILINNFNHNISKNISLNNLINKLHNSSDQLSTTLHYYISKLSIISHKVICLDGINWIDLNHFILTQLNVDIPEDLSKLLSDETYLDNYKCRELMAKVFNSDLS